MKNTFLLFLSLLLGFVSCKTNTEKNKNNLEKNRIDELANRYFELNRFSGTILVIKEDYIVYNSSFGLADYENSKSFTDKTAFKIGDVSELITRDIVEELVNTKQLKLSDSISKYIPELKSKFTIEDLLTHKTNFPSIKTITEKYPELKYNTMPLQI